MDRRPIGQKTLWTKDLMDKRPCGQETLWTKDLMNNRPDIYKKKTYG